MKTNVEQEEANDRLSVYVFVVVVARCGCGVAGEDLQKILGLEQIFYITGGLCIRLNWLAHELYHGTFSKFV